MDFEQELKKTEEQLNKLKDKMEKELQKNPWAAVGIVALVCFILGLLLSPKGRHRD